VVEAILARGNLIVIMNLLFDVQKPSDSGPLAEARLVRKDRQMKKIWIVAVSAAVVLSPAACKSSGRGVAGGPTPVGTSTATASPTPTPTAATPTGTGKAVPTTLDPCKLFTQSEASKLTGVTLGTVKKSSENGLKMCVYQKPGRSLTVQVAQASSVAQAQSEKDKLIAEAKSQLTAQFPQFHPKLSAINGLGDAAENLTASGTVQGINLQTNALYVLQGTIGFDLVDLSINGGKVCSLPALKDAANTVLSRLP
jgi:hypothetical protein